MEQKPAAARMVFHGGNKGFYALIGLGAVLSLALGIWKGEILPWLIFDACLSVPFLLIFAYLRIEIRPDGFRYRNLSMNRTVQFDEIERAYFETQYHEYLPQGTAVFWVQPKTGDRLQVNLLTFPVRAAALLFLALEGHGISVETPDTWAVRSVMREIHRSQEKLKKTRGEES